jgi:thiamine-monophosphate kinase
MGTGELWIGDDAAILRLPNPSDPATNSRILLTTDTAVEGVHADLSLMSLEDMGWRATTAAVSDIAAMGGTPTALVIAIAAPPDTNVDQLAKGIAAASAHYGVPVVGGDLTNAPQVVLTVTVLGHAAGETTPTARNTARAGDSLWVTHPLGGSAAGLRLLRADPHATGPAIDAHRHPFARLLEGRTARAAGATAMIDVSDGLAIDLHRLVDASGVGFELDTLPVADGATEAEALGGGEDYVLLIATPSDLALDEVFSTIGLTPPTRIGHIATDPQIRTLRGKPLARTGWTHAFGSPP